MSDMEKDVENDHFPRKLLVCGVIYGAILGFLINTTMDITFGIKYIAIVLWSAYLGYFTATLLIILLEEIKKYLHEVEK